MIQRIQSIYLVLAGIFPAFTFFLPVAQFVAGDKWLTMYGGGFDETLLPGLAGGRPYELIALAALSMLVALFTIFRFKNRKQQLKLANLAVLFNVVWYLLAAARIYAIQSLGQTELALSVGAAAPLLAIIALLLAKGAIRKDEALVRAADRIR